VWRPQAVGNTACPAEQLLALPGMANKKNTAKYTIKYFFGYFIFKLVQTFKYIQKFIDFVFVTL